MWCKDLYGGISSVRYYMKILTIHFMVLNTFNIILYYAETHHIHLSQALPKFPYGWCLDMLEESFPVIPEPHCQVQEQPHCSVKTVHFPFCIFHRQEAHGVSVSSFFLTFIYTGRLCLCVH